MEQLLTGHPTATTLANHAFHRLPVFCPGPDCPCDGRGLPHHPPHALQLQLRPLLHLCGPVGAPEGLVCLRRAALFQKGSSSPGRWQRTGFASSWPRLICSWGQRRSSWLLLASPQPHLPVLPVLQVLWHPDHSRGGPGAAGEQPAHRRRKDAASSAVRQQQVAGCSPSAQAHALRHCRPALSWLPTLTAASPPAARAPCIVPPKQQPGSPTQSSTRPVTKAPIARPLLVSCILHLAQSTPSPARAVLTWLPRLSSLPLPARCPFASC